MSKTKKEVAVIDVPTNELIVMPSQYDKLIEVGFETNADLERMERLFALKEKHEANEARKAFHLAMAEFKKIPLVIKKTKYNKQYKSWYSGLDDLVIPAIPVMGKNGLSHKWDIDQTNGISVTCFATHALGFSDSVSMSGPPDKSGSKNPLQEIKSTITYLKSVTFESVFGLASTDANLNDDGNASTTTETITEKQENQLVDMLSNFGQTIEAYCKLCNVSELKEIPKTEFENCVAYLTPPKE